MRRRRPPGDRSRAAGPAGDGTCSERRGDRPRPTGGAGYGTTAPGLTASRFKVTPRTLTPGAPASFRYRIDGAQRSARVRIELLAAGSRRPAATIRMGWKRTGRTLTRTWTPPAGVLTPGDYVARLHAVDRNGRTLRRTATASGRSRLTVIAPAPPPRPRRRPRPVAGTGLFPVRGAFTWGDPFGAKRGTVVHRGQDIPTAEGTPIATPRAGVVSWRAYQAAGAGNYVVVHADDGRDFVFMHLQNGSITVTKGAVLGAGQVFAKAGMTGHASGPHLHFEIWPDGWYASDDSQPIDPRPGPPRLGRRRLNLPDAQAAPAKGRGNTVRPRFARPRSLSAWLLLGLALVLLPRWSSPRPASAPSSASSARPARAARATATRVAIAANLQASVEVAEDARARTGRRRRGVAPRVRAALARARSDLTALHGVRGSACGRSASSRRSSRSSRASARPRDVRALGAGLSRLDAATARLADDVVATMRVQATAGSHGSALAAVWDRDRLQRSP